MRHRPTPSFPYVMGAIAAMILILLACLTIQRAPAQTVQNSNPSPGPIGVVGANNAVCDPYKPMDCMRPSTTGALGTTAGQLSPLGYCQLSVTAAAQTSTCSGGIPAGATQALICNEGVAARYRDDGTAPTTTTGMPLGTGTATAPTCMTYSGTLAALEWIAESSTSVLDISFYK